MKQILNKVTGLSIIILILNGCNSVKRVQKNELLLTKKSFFVNGKIDRSENLSKLSFQKTNSKIFGVPLKLHIYNLARGNKDSIFDNWLNKSTIRKKNYVKLLSQKQLNKIKQSSIGFNTWLKITGEAPAILDSLKINKTKQNLERYFFSKGWFDREIIFEVENLGERKASLKYNITTGEPHKIDKVITKIESKVLDSIYQSTYKDSYIRKNDQFNILNYEKERERISSNFRNSGAYKFSKDYVSFENDTIGKNNKIDVKINIANRIIRNVEPITQVDFNIYKIKEVNIYTDASFENRNKLEAKKTATYDNFNFYNFKELKYNPKSIANVIQIVGGNLFSDLDKNRTYRYLNALNTFKYPNIEYIENDNDKTLTTNIYLNPKKKYGLGFDFNISQSNIQKIGLSFSSGLLIRNIFRGAETLELSALGAIGASKDGAKSENKFFDINELGADIKINIPRLFFVINTKKIIPKYMLPKTQIGMGFTGQKNIGLDKQTFNGRIKYNWLPKKEITSTFELLNLQYVRNLNPNNYFNVYQNSFNRLETIALNSYPTPAEYIIIDSSGNESLNISLANEFLATVNQDQDFQINNPNDFQSVRNISERKNRLIQDNLILSSNFNLTRDTRENSYDNDFSIFRFKLELAGNLLNLTSDFLGLKKNSSGEFVINDVAFSQFAKSEFDYIKLWNLGRNNVLAFRSFVGIAIPLGNSSTIPFSESFFAGGSNDNRAWTAYNLGPGRSDNNNEFNEANFKLALSVEHRFKLLGMLNGALFIDAGNIWNVLDDVEEAKEIFKSLKSFRDTAIGSGFGLRYDFGFFILRFDTGFKVYNPSFEIDNRWFRNFNFGNAVYNIGINYPF